MIPPIPALIVRQILMARVVHQRMCPLQRANISVLQYGHRSGVDFMRAMKSKGATNAWRIAQRLAFQFINQRLCQPEALDAALYGEQFKQEIVAVTLSPPNTERETKKGSFPFAPLRRQRIYKEICI
ncbi:hypothetical protein [Antarcticimicrobium sediminis]|uniref:Uncharacterized protein n=1 Tax=Antarcticimicrobium sediminis TaxID=2546227 RepID=A0A4R5EPQ9_9RHOB|nr:hypothetical protein [Antarcticimicrobium sediminis]TDE36739.1 hypothetical protein E1B25_14595 [Antarcticimicrobium sediminis]